MHIKEVLEEVTSNWEHIAVSVLQVERRRNTTATVRQRMTLGFCGDDRLSSSIRGCNARGLMIATMLPS